MPSNSNIVVEWLRSLHLGQYAESFIDNGYDDLEICKQVGEPDLDAIGVLNPAHRQRLLGSVRTLREEGAASVYFTLEEAAAAQDWAKEPPEEAARYRDEYEEGKAELVKIPRVQLRVLLRERLAQDGIRLSLQPYSTPDGDRGFLEGLASRYADLFSTHYGDVLDHIEELRRREWDEMSPRIRVLGAGTPVTPGTPGTPPGTTASCSGERGPLSGHCGQMGTLTTSLSQPIYVPGKYSPSSCLTDKEEDEIYGFGYGVFGRHMAARQQQQRALVGAAGAPHQHQAQPGHTAPLVHHHHHNYQTCLSPRSAYFYEFPPSETCLSTAKKKATTFSRLLRGLKTSHRKEKHGSCSPKQARQARTQGMPPQRVDTPDSVLQSGMLGFCPPGDTALRSMVDPRDYDRLRYFQMNGGAPNTFEETIHRLKVQEAMKKKEKFHREHEEILRDIRHGLLHLGREGRGPMGVETGRSELTDGGQRGNQAGYRQMAAYRMRRPEDGLSPHSSDYEDQEESENDSQHVATVHNSAEDCEGVSGLVGRVRGLRQDVQRKISRLRLEQGVDQPQRRPNNDQAFPCSNSSFESLPSGSGSSTQALVRAGSNHSSISAEDNRELSPTGHGPQILCRARALVDYNPNSYDKDALRYKKGDIIDVISMNASGLWRGIAHNRVGHFKFINVEVLSDRIIRNSSSAKWLHKNAAMYGFHKSRPTTVEDLLHRIGMQEYSSIFIMNGYEDLELFKEIEPSDLDYLGIMTADHRAKILTAVQLLHDMDCSEGDIHGSSSEGDDSKRGNTQQVESPFGRRQFPRDSGCYDAPLHIKTSPLIHRSDNSDHEQNSSDNTSNSPNNLDSVVQQCSNEILKRVESQQSNKLNTIKDDRIEQYLPNIPVPNSVASSNMNNEKCVRTMDSYVIARGQTVSVEPSRSRTNIMNKSALRKNAMPSHLKNSSNNSVSRSSAGTGQPTGINHTLVEDVCESDHKLNVVKYIVGGGSASNQEPTSGGSGGGCLSEKSSDSGVSSSSLSSAPCTRDSCTKPQPL